MILAEMNNIIQIAEPARSGLGVPNQGKGDPGGFSARLENEIRKLDTPNVQEGDALPGEEEPVEGGVKFLSKLEQVLLKISGGNLNDISVSRDGLDSLQQLLIMAGFDPEEVSGIIEGLKEKSGKEGLDLKTVMDSLAQLETDTQEVDNDTDVYLATSSLPFITTLLEAFGLSKADVESLTGAADKGQKGISLNALVRELRSMLEGLPNSGAQLTARESGAEISKMLGHLNLTLTGDGGDEAVTLKDLLSSFDAYIKSKDAAGSGKIEPASVSESLKEAAPALSSAGGKSGVSAQMEKFLAALGTRNGNEVQPEVSFTQVRDQFKNEIIGSGKKGKPGLLSKAEAQNSPDAAMKNFEQVLSKPAAGETAGRGGGAPDFREQGKADLLKQTDLPQNEVGTGKNDILETRFKGMTAKPAERALPSYVTHQVNRSIVRAVNQGESTLTLQLKPAALGRLSLTIDNSGNSIKVSILTENHAAKEMLTSNVNELRTALSASGISLDSFDVDMNSDFKQSMTNTGNQAGNFNRKNNGNGKAFSGGQDLDPEEGTAGMTSSEAQLDGSYHFVA